MIAWVLEKLIVVRDFMARPALLAHAARTTLAALLALYLAFVLQLDTPYSAMVTVMIVSHPVQGSILAKSLWRLGGTLLGGAAAVVLMALAPQTPWLYLAGLAVWVGLGAAASTLLRGFRSYGAVLAGYTVALILPFAVSDPNSIFLVVTRRVAVVSLGIVCSAFVSAALVRPTAERGLERLLAGLLRDLVAYARIGLDPGQGEALRPLRNALGAKIGALETAIQFAAAEMPERALQATALREAAAGMFGAITAAAALTEAPPAHGPALSALLAETREALDLAAQSLAGQAGPAQEGGARDGAGLGGAIDRLDALRVRTQAALVAPESLNDSDALLVGDRLADLLGELVRALSGLDVSRHGIVREGPQRNAIHLDTEWAVRNGVRGALAVMLGGAMWFETAWPSGAMMLAGLTPNVVLLSLRERPSSDAIHLLWGIALGSLLGLFYLLWVLPQITDFPLLALWLAPPVFLAAAAMTAPPTMFYAIGFIVFFITLLMPSNPMVYDPAFFLDSAFATLVGAALTVLVHRYILPVDSRALRRHLLSEISADFARAFAAQEPEAVAWETRMHDRMRLLAARLRAANVPAELTLRNGFAALRLGRDVLRLRFLLAGDAWATQRVLDAIVARIAGERAALANAALFLHARADLPDEAERAAGLRRAAALLPAVESLARLHRHFFRQALSREPLPKASS
ncbi:putative membrane protein YccC [Rhodoblastus acidophilus]|uniref:FUSC family protein n=1 Tax=Rhodoblastus acidophilus TaxID=1074 RepID=UPI002225A896|nr:FUSC family protein [Rhodoblastus acidophilus]MCW2316708.1 putative membrane protein YccC [Rhodoblastus acidophilus]